MFFNVAGLSIGLGMCTAMDTLCSQVDDIGHAPWSVPCIPVCGVGHSNNWGPPLACVGHTITPRAVTGNSSRRWVPATLAC